MLGDAGSPGAPIQQDGFAPRDLTRGGRLDLGRRCGWPTMRRTTGVWSVHLGARGVHLACRSEFSWICRKPLIPGQLSSVQGAHTWWCFGLIPGF